MGVLPRAVIWLSMVALNSAVARNLAAAESAVPFSQRPPEHDHRHQTGLSIMPGIGYRVVVPYETKVCGDSSGDDSKRVCTNTVPFFLDFQLSFGVTSRLDLIVDTRFGVAKDSVIRNRQFALAPGLRFWLDQEVNLKFYATLQALYDSTDHHGNVPASDFGFRNSNGLMYDAIRNVGFFFQFGESAGFRRWFRLELDVGFGVQLRFP